MATPKQLKPTTEPTFPGARILVVDDEQSIRHTLTQLFTRMGYRATEATSGQAALEQIAHRGFDLVILRPLGLVAVAVGAVAFVPAALITAPNGRDGIQSALELFVTEPAKNVFQRPLGDF